MQNFFGRSTGFAFGLEGMQHSTGTSRSGIQWQSHRLWLYSFCCHAPWNEREGDPGSVTSQVRMLFFLRFRVNISGNWLLYLSLATLHTFQSIRESGTWWRRWLLFGYGDCLVSKGEQKSAQKLFSNSRISSSRSDATHLRTVCRLGNGLTSYSQKNLVWLQEIKATLLFLLWCSDWSG